MTEKRRYEQGTQTVTIVPPAGATEADIERNVQRAFEFGTSMIEDDTQYMRLRAKRFGRLVVGAYFVKVVGPPSWPRPRFTASVDRRGLMLGTGWRSTAYTVGVVIALQQREPTP